MKISVHVYILTISIALVSCDIIPKQYIINLDNTANQRWKEVANDFKNESNYLKSIMFDIIPASLIPLVDDIAANLDLYIPAEYVQEMEIFSEVFEMKMAEVFIMNLIYDLSEMCTSIVAEDENGNLVHGRNMDYRFTKRLRAFTIQVEFHRRNKMVYKASTFVGYVGIFTGMNPHKFTISMNERRTSNGYWKDALIMLLDNKVNFSGFLIRDTLENAVSFTDAVVKLAYSDTMAPSYFIVGGATSGQAAVVTKNDLKPDAIRYINLDKNIWYVVETNYDWWLPAPKSDDRRAFAVKYLNALGSSNVTVDSIYKVLSTPPLYRENHMTIYTTIMSAAQPDMFRTVIRDQD